MGRQLLQIELLEVGLIFKKLQESRIYKDLIFPYYGRNIESYVYLYISEVIQTIAVTYCYMLLLAFYNHHHVTSIGRPGSGNILLKF